MTLSIKEYDKVVRRFVDDYVDNLTPDQLREIVSEQSHIDFENIRKDFGQIGVWEEMSGWDSDLFDMKLSDLKHYLSEYDNDAEVTFYFLKNDTLTNCQLENIGNYGMGIEFTIQDTSEYQEAE